MAAAAGPAGAGPALVFQEECVISRSRNIATLGFGPCYVLTGYHPQTQHSFLAHLDDMTQVESLSALFACLRDLGVRISELTQVRLMGGWAGHGESAEWGRKIKEVLQREAVPNVDYSLFQQKIRVDMARCTQEELLRNKDRHFFPGGLLDAASGQFKMFKNQWERLEKQAAEKADQRADALLRRRVPGYNPQRDKYSHQMMLVANQLLMSEPEVPLSIRVED